MIPETLSIDGASELFVFEMDIFLLMYLYGITVGIIHVLKNLHTFDERIPSLNDRETDQREVLQPLFLERFFSMLPLYIVSGNARVSIHKIAQHSIICSTHYTYYIRSG